MNPAQVAVFLFVEADYCVSVAELEIRFAIVRAALWFRYVATLAGIEARYRVALAANWLRYRLRF